VRPPTPALARDDAHHTPEPLRTLRPTLPAVLLLAVSIAAPAAAQLVIGGPPPPRDTAGVFDSPATAALVDRVIAAGSGVPPELRDYHATMKSAAYLSVRPDSAPGGEQPVTIDEFAGEVRWERGGAVLQRVRGHRVRMLAPTPYTIGTMLESPWVIPHLYGNTIDVFQLAPTASQGTRVSRAIHPFSARGEQFYRYAAGDTVRIRTSEGATTLIPVTVSRRAGAVVGREQLVVGTFYVDVDRAAVARARFGFVQRGGGFSLAETGVFFDLESGLVAGRYWLPYRQRREIQITSPLFGGAAAIRLVTTLSGFQVNTGWQPEAPGRSRLVLDLAPRGENPFAGWPREIGAQEGGSDIADFGDLREVVRPQTGGGPVKVALRYEHGEHLFRYDRVEGLYLGGGALAQPRDAAKRFWDVYATAGWAFSEGTARGEVDARWHPMPVPAAGAPVWTYSAGAYRRLVDTQVFRSALRWEIGRSLNAALSGVDERDFYDSKGVEAFATRRSGPWTAKLGGRFERQDLVTKHTDRTIFGAKARRFPDVGPADEGTHGAVEADLRFNRGAGAFGLGNSLVAGVHGETGLADFRFTRFTAMVSTRRDTRFVSVLARADGGQAFGETPPQYLFRFGGDEGLRGYRLREFGGSSAALARGRLLLHLPPYGNEPLFRIGFFAVPPLRPAVVLAGETGWSDVSDRSAAALARLGSAPTDGWKGSYGTGVSIFDDAVSAEYVRPTGGGKGKWYVGFVQWF
jgi:hypothetical protein